MRTVASTQLRTALALASLLAAGLWSGQSKAQNSPAPSSSMNSMQGMGAMGSKKAPAPQSIALEITVNGKTSSFTVADLSGLPQKTVKVHNSHDQADESYTGVGLSDLLTKAGFIASSATQQQMLRSYVRAEGTDHYWVIYSLVEVEPSEHSGDVIVATSLDGHSLGADGQLKLIAAEDRKPQRWIRNLAGITVRTAE